MAHGAETPTIAAPRLAPRPGRQVVVPEDLLELVGEERIRKFHARLAAQLKNLPRGGQVRATFDAAPGGRVIDAHLGNVESL